MKLLFIDTETTGRPKSYSAPISDLDNWPRLVEVAWLVGSENENREVTLGKPTTCVVMPDGFRIPWDAVKIHGITTADALETGEPLEQVLSMLRQAIQDADRIVAHNVSFDVPVLRAEFLRAMLDDPLEKKVTVCTMQDLTDWCQIPDPCGGGWKFPNLMELHVKLFGRKFRGAHHAENDVVVCAACYREARRRGLL